MDSDTLAMIYAEPKENSGRQYSSTRKGAIFNDRWSNINHIFTIRERHDLAQCHWILTPTCTLYH